jgi:hypothetical protein
VYPTQPKENLELYFLFLEWELGTVRYCESLFCSSVSYDNLSQNLSNVISENTAAFYTYNASA